MGDNCSSPCGMDRGILNLDDIFMTHWPFFKKTNCSSNCSELEFRNCAQAEVEARHSGGSACWEASAVYLMLVGSEQVYRFTDCS